MRVDWRRKCGRALDTFAAWLLAPVVVGLTWIGLTVHGVGWSIFAVMSGALIWALASAWRSRWR